MLSLRTTTPSESCEVELDSVPVVVRFSSVVASCFTIIGGGRAGDGSSTLSSEPFSLSSFSSDSSSPDSESDSSDSSSD